MEDGATLGKDLVAKFDFFLCEGYSMVSINLLLLEGATDACLLRQQQRKDDDNDDVDASNTNSTTVVNCRLREGCARTDNEYRGNHFRFLQTYGIWA